MYTVMDVPLIIFLNHGSLSCRRHFSLDFSEVWTSVLRCEEKKILYLYSAPPTGVKILMISRYELCRMNMFCISDLSE